MKPPFSPAHTVPQTASVGSATAALQGWHPVRGTGNGSPELYTVRTKEKELYGPRKTAHFTRG
jgi:hypothetical protein